MGRDPHESKRFPSHGCLVDRDPSYMGALWTRTHKEVNSGHDPPSSHMSKVILILIKEDKYVVWENLIVLNVMRLYLNKIQYEKGNQCSF